MNWVLATHLPTDLEDVQLLAVHKCCSTPAVKDLTLDLKLLLSLLVVTLISQLLVKEKDHNVQPSENQLHRHHICLVLTCEQQETEVSRDSAMSFYLITNASWSLFSGMQRGYFYMHRLATTIRINPRCLFWSWNASRECFCKIPHFFTLYDKWWLRFTFRH